MAQDRGTLNPEPLPPLANPDDRRTPARELFARKTTPAALPPRAIGFYTKGCLAGAVALPINGANWQVMRVSRNRNWGHPSDRFHRKIVRAYGQERLAWTSTR